MNAARLTAEHQIFELIKPSFKHKVWYEGKQFRLVISPGPGNEVNTSLLNMLIKDAFTTGIAAYTLTYNKASPAQDYGWEGPEFLVKLRTEVSNLQSSDFSLF